MKYEGPIYRPPSEAKSLLVQATVGCPFNKCTFCMVYKNGIHYKCRPPKEIKQDLREAAIDQGDRVQTLFFPSGNTIAMPTSHLCEICTYAKTLFKNLKRITVYGSSKYIFKKGPADLKQLARAGLSRIHVGFESGCDHVLTHIQKGTCKAEQIQAGRWTIEAGIELSLYVILGIGGQKRSASHVLETTDALNQINPQFIRFRTFVPKINTPLLTQVQNHTFKMLSPHQVINEAKDIIQGLKVTSTIASDHYTNYVNLEGQLPHDKERLIKNAKSALKQDESTYRPFFVGQE